jgi:hypothetical protein
MGGRDLVRGQGDLEGEGMEIFGLQIKREV